jgi:hypothetical protein
MPEPENSTLSHAQPPTVPEEEAEAGVLVLKYDFNETFNHPNF